MGYADDLYDIDNVVCGLRICEVNPENQQVIGRGALIVAFVKKGNSFGLITKSIGRRIAMDSSMYSCQFAQGFIEEKLDGATLFSVSSNEEDVPEVIVVTPDNRSEFEDLLDSNQELNPADNLVYMRAFHDYSQNYTHPSGSLDILGPALFMKNAMAKAVHNYMKVIRPPTPENMELAKAEYGQILSNMEVPGLRITDGFWNHLPEAQIVKPPFAALLRPIVDAVPHATVEAAAQLPVARTSKHVRKEVKESIVNRPSHLPR